MSITGKNTLSIRKTDVKESKSLAQGFTKLVFAHKASVGDGVITLGSLTVPTEMSALGFTNPSPSKLAEAKLFQFKSNLTLISSLRGLLIQDLSYRINSSSSIVLEGFTAEDGEIFTGIIDANPTSGIQVIDAKQAVAKGDLVVGVTDFNLGFSTKTTSEDIIVIRNGLVQTRNTSNSSTVLDGNYFVIDSGSGYGSVVRFNVAPGGSGDSILVVSLGGIVESPTNSTWDELEKLQGQIDAIVPVLAEATELPETTFQGAPNDIDRKQFGDRVITLERILDVEVFQEENHVTFAIDTAGNVLSDPLNVVQSASWIAVGRLQVTLVNGKFTVAPNLVATAGANSVGNGSHVSVIGISTTLVDVEVDLEGGANASLTTFFVLSRVGDDYRPKQTIRSILGL